MSVTHLLMRLFLGRRLPTTTGELRVRGPSAPVTIRRDGNGVPHIDAESELDAYYALGFCQGQDRAAQLETMWRVGRGRLAEWVGAAGLGADRMSRRIGFHASSEKQYPVLSEVVKRRLEAFAAGITAGNSVGLPHAPHEFAILGGTPSPWAGIDVLTLMKLQSFSLASNWDVELARLRILLSDGPEALLAFDPLAGHGDTGTGGQGDKKSLGEGVAPLVSVSHGPLVQLHEDVAALRDALPLGGGSNNWVIAGSRTASGKSILASDPHLAPSAPPPWYLAHARCPEWEAAGAQLAGTPTFSIAHNGFAAWGVTAGLTDNSDIYLEELGPDGRTAKCADGSFAPCEVRREVIRVKGAADEVVEVIVTPRGPIITPLVEDVSVAVSLRAVWLEPLPVNGYFGAVTARSFEEFRRSFAEWPVLPLNVLYADINGGLGWQLIGQIPQRAAGHGLVPRPGWLPDSEWKGMVPFDAMPYRTDFPKGYFATANNEPEWPSREPWLSADYCDPYRVRSITDALGAKDTGWTVEDCLALQRGVRSIPWEEVRDTVLSLTPTSPDAADGLELLEEWDGQVGSESPAAAVFELFLAEMCVRTAKVKTPKAWRAALGERGGPLDDNFFVDRRIAFLVRQLNEQPTGWFASWPAEMEAALGKVVLHLRTTVGPGPAYWAWGHLRQLRLDHPLFKNHAWLGPVFNLGPVPCGGDTNTISQAGAKPTNPTGFTHNMANMRTAFDLGDLAKSRFVLCGGQSGNPWSDHHADQLPLWQAGESIPIPWLQAEVIRASRATLRLLPAGEGKGERGT
ncbi:peptidase s45 penicillin amidase : Penicillin acylase II OS=Thermomicrobium roseum (strain ATCC 27502 / DSM 5159 / P-2) GN=trd_1119 PE=4 SV=1: Penicil_amidase [Gemmataceae bacterium]|nr:peptidase s45 penicillin amidase : Penicillin acylase II OS=Thermomicrobium roseum (strain ATCC 27502 / DSM 5159 / P-2) GN=trd_1119 PE=4 SV=1: Penicil_amidase [Gemmataceae bacterium]VTT98564.1 peptidase s45 penicillin amidase : Penicillin acylase II OS=Thermomicrobium roseum (strain ATCC 27502 / DSM 5159 / P-2) GN=trd_1119 PE=4 SV=1: Penicil_amidase [Gemmataceae bacterium]